MYIACDVIVMTTHRLGMATHQPLMQHSIVWVSHDNHSKLHVVNLIGMSEFKNKPKEALRMHNFNSDLTLDWIH